MSSSPKERSSTTTTTSSGTQLKQLAVAKARAMRKLNKPIEEKKQEYVVLEGKLRTIQRHLQVSFDQHDPDKWTEAAKKDFRSNEKIGIEYAEQLKTLQTTIELMETSAAADKDLVQKEYDASVAELEDKDDVGNLKDVEGEEDDDEENGAAGTSKSDSNIGKGGGSGSGETDDENGAGGLVQMKDSKSGAGDDEESDPSDIAPKRIDGAIVYPDFLKVIRKKGRDELRRLEQERLNRGLLLNSSRTPQIPIPVENARRSTANVDRSSSVILPTSPEETMVSLMERQLKLTQQLANRSVEAEERDLPPFSGRAEEWLVFIERFEATKSRSSDGKNLARLRKALKGPAMKAVSSLFNCPSNIDTIIANLKMEFGRPQLVIEALIQQVKKTKNPDPTKPETIVEFGRGVEALVASIKGQNVTGYLDNVYLINQLVEKLPTSLKREWALWTAKAGSPETLNMFAKFVAKEKELACRFLQPKVQFDERSERKDRQGRFHAAVGYDNDDKRCIFCEKGAHHIKVCKLFEKKSPKERNNFIREKRACFSCLLTGHISTNCQKRKPCGVNGCVLYHHPLLHWGNASQPNKAGSKWTEHNGGVNASLISGSDGAQPIVPVMVRGPLGSRKAYALLDSGATSSLIKRDIADLIGLSGQKGSYVYCGVNGQKIIEPDSIKCELEIKGLYRAAVYSKMGARTVSALPLPAYSINMPEVKKTFSHLKNIPAAALGHVTPDLIIGSNNPLLILARKIVKGKPGEPVAWRSKLGWTIAGEFNTADPGSVNYLFSAKETDDYLHQLIKSSFTTDNFGVKPTSRKGSNFAEDRALQILEKTTKESSGSWETGLLWKSDQVVLPESQNMAYKRLLCTERKMKDSEFAKLYKDKITECKDKGYIRKLTTEEINVNSGKVFYIPHFGVVNPNKPGKFRLVFDAAAKVEGKSLNDFLFTGPDLIRPLISVLINFRRHQVALTGDIADMFHRVKITEDDKSAQRFLWREGNANNNPDHYQMEVMIFGATCSPSSAIYVKNKNAEKYKDKYPKAAKIIVDDFYVDDCLTGGESAEEVIELRKQISSINGAGGFQVCKWNSNSDKVLASIPLKLHGGGPLTFCEKDSIQGERVLGLWWDPKRDVFTFKVQMNKVKKDVLAGRVPTKREELCSLVMSLYDPLGFINHYKIKGVMLLQQTWGTGIGWDDEIPLSINDRWQAWLAVLESITEVEVPRCYSSHLVSGENVQLHIFVDASEEAFAAVGYLRIKTNNEINVSLVCSKAKVAPVKKLTIPRLELQAAVLGTRIATMLKKELRVNINTRYFWSDSKTVLSWIYSTDKKHNEFVSNRIGEIQEDTNPQEWRWVPSKANVADVATRFNSEISFNKSSEWYTGPAFLLKSENEWPEAPTVEEPTEEDNAELVATVVCEQLANLEQVPDPDRFSCYNRLLRATAAVIVCSQIWKNKTFHHTSVEDTDLFGLSPTNKLKVVRSPISPVHLKQAETSLITWAQGETFHHEIEILNSNKSPKEVRAALKKGKIWRLSPFLDDEGVLRMEGRLDFANIEYEAKHPAILPRRSKITELIVDQEHVRACHQGIGTVMVALMRRFAIIGMREAVKRGFRRCQSCRIRFCKPIQPRMGQLPHFRVDGKEGHPPFYHTGIDYFGPMEVVVGRRREKRWGVILTCMATRAIHLEIAHHLSTDEAIMAICRFISSRGRPHTITSDNGTNFVGAAHEFKLNWEKVVESAKNNNNFQSIVWKFQPARSPHMGGAWERLVGSVKRCLKSVLLEKAPKDTTLLTLMKEVENTVNSRPLTVVSTDAADPIPITPNDIIRGRTDIGPPFPYDDRDENLKAAWRRTQHLADVFWKRWSAEFLPQLLKREKWEEKAENLEVGDLVFLVDDLQPRNTWRRGYIGKTFPGEDGQVRVVEVYVRDSGKITAFRRAVNRVCPLGIRMDLDTVGDGKETNKRGRRSQKESHP